MQSSWSPVVKLSSRVVMFEVYQWMFFIYLNPWQFRIAKFFLCVFVLKPFHDFPCCLCFWWLNPLLDRWEMHICHKNIFDVCLFSCSCWTVRFDCFLEDQICFIFIFELWIILCLNLLYVKRISIQIFWQCNEKGWLDLNVLRCHKQSCVFTYKTLWRSEIII